MVKDAESHAEEDRKLMETVQARNGLDALVHSVKKSVTEYGDKVGADEKAKIEAAVKDAEELLKQPDASKDALEAKSEALAKAAQKLGETMYADAQAAAGAAGGGAGAQGAGGGRRAEGRRREGGGRRVHRSQGSASNRIPSRLRDCAAALSGARRSMWPS